MPSKGVAQNPFETYLSELAKTRASATSAGGRELEHQHRPALSKLLESILPGVQALNEPGKTEFGMPDFALVKSRWPMGYVETKKVDARLNDIAKGDQLKRYFGYANLVLTNYVEFRFYKHGEPYGTSISIADAVHLAPDYVACELLKSTFNAFLNEAAEPVRRAETLAKIMGENAKRLRGNLLRFLKSEDIRNQPILDIFDAFKTQLIHDLSLESFTDMYAQTLVYGLFVARYHDDTPATFDRQEARDLIPATNPLLRRFFDHITGTDFDVRLKPIVDELCKVFENADVKKLMQQLYSQNLWGGVQAGPDPVVHFYEDFLREYDAKQRKDIGAFYTPPPVVRFIVRSVDAVLKRDFGLPTGLADTSKIEIVRTKQGKKSKEQVHRVQVLDPATGTGTFLTETIRLIHASFEGQEGRFTQYVNEDLLPRLHGFELMMAPYTIAHLKIGATLTESGAKQLKTRLGIYLTNSLEEGHTEGDSLFGSLGLSQAISNESREASVIKKETPIMTVIGNPPYNVKSKNPSIAIGVDGKKRKTWIGALIDDYKKDLNERKINLDDDYIKFIRLSEHFIEKNGAGVVAMITNNSYIDGITHRQMRKHLLETFDEVYILNLYGDSKKNEKTSDGGKDENVFGIRQGVAICIFIRKEGKKEGLGTIYHSEILGRRSDKLTVLEASSIENVEWHKLESQAPNYFFVPKNFNLEQEYRMGFALNDFFPNYNSGIQTKNDDLTIRFSDSEMKKVVDDFLSLNLDEIENKYNIDDSGIWKASIAQKDLQKTDYTLSPLLYRPFDVRYTVVTPRSGGFLARPRIKTTRQMFFPNVALLFSRNVPSQGSYTEVLVSDMPVDLHAAAGQTYCAPLYTYEDDGSKTLNFESGILTKILQIVPKVEPINIFDYIYAVLLSPEYRKAYEVLLKTDFPRIPYPKSEKEFEKLTKIGKELRDLHLLVSPRLNQFITKYPEIGSNSIEKLRRTGNKVYINSEQYFDGVSDEVWNFTIGGYLPAQKWLKDRTGRTLSNAEIEHYQKMIVALHETKKIMATIDSN